MIFLQIFHIFSVIFSTSKQILLQKFQKIHLTQPKYTLNTTKNQNKNIEGEEERVRSEGQRVTDRGKER